MTSNNPNTKRGRSDLDDEQLQALRKAITIVGRKQIAKAMKRYRGFSLGMINLVAQGERQWSVEAAKILEKRTGIDKALSRPDYFS